LFEAVLIYETVLLESNKTQKVFLNVPGFAPHKKQKATLIAAFV